MVSLERRDGRGGGEGEKLQKKEMEIAAVDPRFPLSYYYRIANQIIKEAKVYREEAGTADLYSALSRYIRLVSNIVPQHPSYPIYSSKEKLYHKKVLEEFVKEFKNLNAQFRKTSKQPTGSSEDGYHLMSQRWAQKDQIPESNERKVACYGIERENNLSARAETVGVASARVPDINVHVVRKSFPSPVLSCVQDLPLIGHVTHIVIPDSRNEHLRSSCEETSTSRVFQDVHISVSMMEEFMELARSNTTNELETCGLLGAFLKNRTFYVTTLIIPKQESTSSSCQALNEEEIYAIQDERSLFPVGWIHTHPSQTCFMSSIDLHTQYSYQVMLPEAVAIVMAPTDASRSYGIFRLSDPGGISVLKECEERGFHPHRETADGSPIYEDCSNVYMNPTLRFEIIDLR